MCVYILCAHEVHSIQSILLVCAVVDRDKRYGFTISVFGQCQVSYIFALNHIYNIFT